MSKPTLTTYLVRDPHPLRHPIRWWKLRHLRRIAKRPRTEAERRMDEAMDRALLFGCGEARRQDPEE